MRMSHIRGDADNVLSSNDRFQISKNEEGTWEHIVSDEYFGVLCNMLKSARMYEDHDDSMYLRPAADKIEHEAYRRFCHLTEEFRGNLNGPLCPECGGNTWEQGEWGCFCPECDHYTLTVDYHP